MMNRQRPNYKKGKLVGRLLEPTNSYTHDFDAQPLTLQIKDWSTGLNVLDEQGQPIVYETRTSDAAMPDGYDDSQERGAAGTFQIELAAGEYALIFDAVTNGPFLITTTMWRHYSFSYDLGGTVTLDVDIPAKEIPSCIYELTGEVNGGIDGRNFEIELIDANTPADMAVRTLSMSSDGRFRFECLDPSIEYRVKVTGENYAPAVSQRVTCEEQLRETIGQLCRCAAIKSQNERQLMVNETRDSGESRL